MGSEMCIRDSLRTAFCQELGWRMCVRTPLTHSRACIRAKKHEANNLRGASTPTHPTVSAVAHSGLPQLQNTVSSNTATIKDLRAEISKLRSEVKQPTKRATSQGGQIKQARTPGKAVNAPAAQQQAERCTYPGCKFRHDINKCSLQKADLANGFERVPA